MIYELPTTILITYWTKHDKTVLFKNKIMKFMKNMIKPFFSKIKSWNSKIGIIFNTTSFQHRWVCIFIQVQKWITVENSNILFNQYIYKSIF